MRKSLASGAVLLMLALGACSSGSGDSDGAGTGGDSSKDSAAAFDPCKKITPAEAEAVLGYPVVVEETPGGGCSWGNEADAHLASLSVAEGTPADGTGGLEGSKSGTTSVIDGEAQDVSGLGDGAYLVLGPIKAGGGESIQAQGAILDGDQLIVVGITQLGGAAITEDAVRAQAEAGMKLVASKL